MITTILIFIFAALAAEIAGTIGGFGSSIFFVPIAGLFFDFQTVLAITAILHVFSNSSKLMLFRKQIDYKLLFWLGIPSVIMVIVGAEVTVLVTFKYIQLVLGFFIIIFSTLFFFYPDMKLPQTKLITVSAGSLAGFMAGLIGTGGAIRGLSLAAFNLSKGTFVATSAAIDFGVDIGRSAIYLSHDFFDRKYVYLIPILFVVALLGSYIGKLILNRIKAESFRKIILVLLFAIGSLEIIKWFTN